jgi:hypothetical protein
VRILDRANFAYVLNVGAAVEGVSCHDDLSPSGCIHNQATQICNKTNDHGTSWLTSRARKPVENFFMMLPSSQEGIS